MADVIKLTEYTKYSGCGAKLGPGLLEEALCGLEGQVFPQVLVDFRTFDDAGVYRISGGQVMIQTVDFFPPMADDPFVFGQIAAANALSDIYAMGGFPTTALSILCFPRNKMGKEVLRKIAEGGLRKLEEAETALIGGHSIEDEDLKCGYAITGFANEENIWKNNTLRQGDEIYLTKPLGTGVVICAAKNARAKSSDVEIVAESMACLNKTAAEVLRRWPVTAATDVTGFGLAGHCCEMVANTAVGIHIDFSCLHFYPGVLDYAEQGLTPDGTTRNRNFRQRIILNNGDLSEDTLNLLFDPQTSGGLLFGIHKASAKDCIADLKASGVTAHKIGAATGKAGSIEVST